MIPFFAGAVIGIIAGILMAPDFYLAHAKLFGIWPPKDEEPKA